MSHTSVRRSAVAALALSLGLGACGTSAAPTGTDRQVASSRAEATLAGGLVQTVTLDPTSPTAGDDVTIRSVIVNRGTAPVSVVSRMCGLDYAGTLVLTGPPHVLKCGAYSQQSTIAPGDSVVTADYMRVSVPPGAYRLRVRHALDPEGWVELGVTVRGS